MNTLKRNDIILNWLLAYVGITKNWLSTNEVLTEINPEELNKLNEDMIGALYTAVEEDKEAFLKLLQQIVYVSDDLFKMGAWVWSIAFLNDIFKANRTVAEKLKDIANLWAMVDYPKRRESFIYYMPVAENEETGEDKIYEKFTGFLRQENIKLREQGYLS